MIAGLKALTFDTGGTILDGHRGLSEAFAAAGARRALHADWPAITNEYRRRSLQAIVGQVNPSFNIDDVHHEVLGTVIPRGEKVERTLGRGRRSGSGEIPDAAAPGAMAQPSHASSDGRAHTRGPSC